MARSRDTSGTRSPQASTSFPRREEARPFPLMAPSPTPSNTSPTPSRDDSCERDASANFSDRESADLSPVGASTVHPGEGGIFNFNSGEGGGPVRLTNLTPISPTNEDVYSSAELRNNPQPPISNSFLQVLSPTRPVVGVGGGYPFLFSGHGPPIFSMQHENEKYRKLMLKKQKRESKKEKNVLNVFKAEDVEGHKGEEDINSVLQSMGEKVEEKKVKNKKPKEKIEKFKADKRERGNRKSVEKELEVEEEGDEIIEDLDREEEQENVKIVNKARNKFVDDDLVAFKNNFYLVTPEPGPLTRHKSRDCLAGSVESLPGVNTSPQMSFTKVTSKKHRTKRSKEETGKPPPGPPAPPDGRRAGYALRSREANNHRGEIVCSPTESIVSVGEQKQPSRSVDIRMSLEVENFPKLAKDDFPALPGGRGSEEDSEGVVITALPSAWARLVSKSSDNTDTTENSAVKFQAVIEHETDTVSSSLTRLESETKDSKEEVEADQASDHSAVIDCDVPSDSSDQETGCEDYENTDNKAASEVKDSSDVEDISVTKTDIYADLTNFPVGNEEGIDTEGIDNIEVITSEDEFNRRKADNSAPVVIFSETAQDWTSSEFTFGFDVNEDLVANSNTIVTLESSSSSMPPHQQPQQMWSLPLTPIDSVDGAILSFGGQSDPMRPLIVGVPVGLPVPVSMAGHPFYGGVLPPPFPAYYSHPLPPQGLIQHQYQEDELELVGDKGVELVGEDQTISPESGISSASPLSWQPDSSPSLPAPGSYPHARDTPALPLISHVSQSLSSWQGHRSTHSDSSNSSRSSPTPGWATQVENDMDTSGKAVREQDINKTNDSGLASEHSNLILEKDLKQKKNEKFNLGEIVNFISSSWSSVSQDSSVSVYSSSSHGQHVVA